MAKYVEVLSALGSRMMKFRKSHDLTQADLAERYKVSGPAIFKFEKGFVTPSLRLWLTIAADMGVPEKEAVLLWVKEKLPRRHNSLIKEAQELDLAPVESALAEAAKGPDALNKMRNAILDNPNISPPLKKFVSRTEMWEILKPSAAEIVFLLELDRAYPLLTVAQFRDALLVGREIAASS